MICQDWTRGADFLKIWPPAIVFHFMERESKVITLKCRKLNRREEVTKTDDERNFISETEAIAETQLLCSDQSNFAQFEHISSSSNPKNVENLSHCAPGYQSGTKNFPFYVLVAVIRTVFVLTRVHYLYVTSVRTSRDCWRLFPIRLWGKIRIESVRRRKQSNRNLHGMEIYGNGKQKTLIVNRRKYFLDS